MQSTRINDAEASEFTEPQPETEDEAIAAVAERLTISGRPLAAQDWLRRRSGSAASPAPAMLEQPKSDEVALAGGNLEVIVGWALARAGRLPWRNPADWELSMDQGLTARQRRKDRGHWYLVEAGAQEMMDRDRLPGGSSAAKSPGRDAGLVVAAIELLGGDQRRLVKFYGLAQTKRSGSAGIARPGFIADQAARPVLRDGTDEVKVVRHTGRGRRKRNVPAYCPLAWPVDPETICASHEVYATWHRGMSRLVEMLRGELSLCHDIWFSAPPRPWEGALQNTA